MANSRLIQFFIAVSVLSILVFFLGVIVYDEIFGRSIQISFIGNSTSTSAAENSAPLKSAKLADPPEIIKAIYLSSASAASEEKISYAVNLTKETEINAVVIDIKDFSGYIYYDTKVPDAEKYSAKRALIDNIDAVIKRFHDENIYVVARAVVFQDPRLALSRPDIAVHSASKLSAYSDAKYTAKTLWRDNKGLSWMDPAAKDVWDYNIAILKDADSRGFDEINLDYIRFPSDGALSDMRFPVWDGKAKKSETIAEFFEYLNNNLPEVKISADLFGYTTINKDDLGIGQIIEDVFGNVDYISPMVYPSHYSNGFLGHQSPASYPYDVVNYSMRKAGERLKIYKVTSGLKRNTRLRPWLQDFTIRGVYYGHDKVRAQIQATEDALGEGYVGYMLWNARNAYTKEAIY